MAPFYFTACYIKLANTPFRRFFPKHRLVVSSQTYFNPARYILDSIFFSFPTYIFPNRNFSLHTVRFVLTFFPAGTSRCTQCTLYLHFSLRELLVAHGALCTYIFPCWNFSLHTVHFVLTFFPAGTSRCIRCTLYLHFSLLELLVAYGALCTYIFPCWNFSLHTMQFVSTLFVIH